MVLRDWTVTEGIERASFRTLMAWDSFEAEQYGGIEYGMKSASFETVLDLPRRTDAPLELDFFDPSQVPTSVRDHGWLVAPGRTLTDSPRRYQQYVRDSKAEFSVSKHGYVVSNCGWFSDRSATFLASGRPVVLQDTGFSEILPTGDGLLSYRTIDEALSAVEDVQSRYGHHCRAARDVAVEYFDSKKVLSELLAEVT